MAQLQVVLLAAGIWDHNIIKLWFCHTTYLIKKLLMNFSIVKQLFSQLIDTVNQGKWSLSIQLKLECFVFVE